MEYIRMDGEKNKRDENSYIEDLKRAELFYKKALLMLESDLETAANRIYLSFENAAHGFLSWKDSQASKKHAQIWEQMSKAHLQGLLSFDPKSSLEKSYQFHLFVDYGKKEFKGENIHLEKGELKKLLEVLKRLLDEINKTIK